MLNISIISPDEEIFSGEGEGIQLPGAEGRFEIKTNHAPLISTLSDGQILVRTPKGEKTFEAVGGVVEVLNNKVIVLVERLAQPVSEVVETA